MRCAYRMPATLLAGAGIACSGGAGEGAPASTDSPFGSGAGAVVRDSAGVRIVENAQHAPDSTSWWIDTVPSVVIGGDESLPEPYLFTFIGSAAWLSDGSLVVADQRMQDVRVFDASGTFVRRIGRHGQGPGEFNGVARVYVLAGDTVVVQSVYAGGPTAYFGPDGAFVRNRPPAAWDGLDGSYGGPLLEAFFDDGSALVTARAPERLVDGVPYPGSPTLVTLAHRLVRVDPEGRVVADFGEHPSELRLRYASVDPENRPFNISSGGGFLPAPRRAVHGSRLFVTDGDSFEVRVYRADGNLDRLIRKLYEPAPFPRAWAEERWRSMMERAAETGAPDYTWIRELTSPPLPEAAPALDRMTVDALGNLWVRGSAADAAAPGQSGLPNWFVFDSTGVLRHSLRTSLEPTRIGADEVLVVARDEYGVPRVEIYPLRKR